MKASRIALAALLGVGAWQLGAGLCIHLKAWLSQQLIAHAWEQTLEGRQYVRPWPWADTSPVARLRAPALGIDQFVLADASGRSLAFGPGLVAAQATNIVIAGHRDTHFRFLRDLGAGERIELQAADGRTLLYTVTGSLVADSRNSQLRLDASGPALTLITCYPFDSVTSGGPLRYVVSAELTRPDHAAAF